MLRTSALDAHCGARTLLHAENACSAPAGRRFGGIASVPSRPHCVAAADSGKMGLLGLLLRQSAIHPPSPIFVRRLALARRLRGKVSFNLHYWGGAFLRLPLPSRRCERAKPRPKRGLTTAPRSQASLGTVRASTFGGLALSASGLRRQAKRRGGRNLSAPKRGRSTFKAFNSTSLDYLATSRKEA